MARSTQDRKWQVDGDPFLVNDYEEVAQALSEAATILTRIGGAIIIVAQREEVAPDLFHTTGFVMKWESYAPAVRRKPDEPESDSNGVEPVGAASSA